LKVRQINESVLFSIAFLCSNYKLSEAQACKILGVSHSSFISYLDRESKNEEFSAFIDRCRAERIVQLVDSIDKAGKGGENHRPDWRAHAFLLEKLFKQFERKSGFFSETNNSQSIIVSDKVWQEALSKALTSIKNSLPEPNPNQLNLTEDNAENYKPDDNF
jgi:hypothetical protein